MGEAVGVWCGWGTCGPSTQVENVRGLRKGMHNNGSPDVEWSGVVNGAQSLAPE